jgi:uncharacterized delta-60 repeat protein
MKHTFTVYIVCILLLGLFAFLPSVNAYPGDLDTTFSFDGISFEAIGRGGNDDVYAVAIQPDGKIVVVGSALYGYKTNCSIVRYNADGSFDTSFDGDGKVSIGISSDPFVCRDVAIQTDGKIIAIGDTTLVRVNPNGSLDISFDGDGKVSTPTGHFNSVGVQTDGKIVAAGYTGSDGMKDFTLVRFNPNGSLDILFDADGAVTTPVLNADDVANALAIQPDGKIVAAGYSYTSTNQDYAVVRYNIDGSLDTTFDSDGKVTTHLSFADIVNSVAIQPDGKIIAAGYSGSPLAFSLVRYNADGSLDATFDTDGLLMTSILGVGDLAYDVAIQTDGKIIAAGYGGNGSGTNITLVRYNPNGSLDTSFDGDGKLTTPVSTFTDYAYGVGIQTDGKIITTGYSRHGSSTSNYNNDSVLIRYNADGSLDTSFDGDGKLIVDLGVGNSTAYSVAIQTDGKIVAAGYSLIDMRYVFTVARCNPDGSYDTSFDGDGIVTTAIRTGGNMAYAVAIQPDGKIVAAGYSYSDGVPDFDFTLVRYNPDGSLDTSFDGDGMVTTAFLNSDNYDYANALAIQSDGKIIAAGYSVYFSAAQAAALVRYNPDGSLDTSFDGDGKLTIFSSGFSSANALAIQTDGKIVSAGSGINGGNSDFSLVRLNPDGSFDNSFDGDGRVITPILTFNDYANGVAIQPDGKIVAAGRSILPSNAQFGALVRYNPDGSLDTSFDGDGKVTTVSGTGFYDVAIQTNGRILASSGGLVRYNPNGSLDNSYGTNGIASFSGFGGGSVALDSNGRAVIGGSADGGVFAVGRVLAEFSPIAAAFDFDGDGKSDISIFRPGTGEWWVNRSSSGSTSALQFGASTDKIVPGDYTGDYKTDVAVWRPSTGEWFVLRSEDNSYFSIPFGANGDVPLASDYDGDTRADFAVYRPSNFVWYINKSSGGVQIYQFGASGDIPVTGDYDRDGKTDVAVYRPANGFWYITKSSDATFLVFRFGTSTDKPVPGDYTGDGKADVAIFRPATGEWFVLRSENQSYYSFPFGINGDIPAPGDFDGDGKFDATVFRPSSNTWYSQRTTAGTLIQAFGQSGDQPVPNAFVP